MTLVLLLLSALSTVTSWASEIPLRFEPEYSRAVIAFNSGNYDETLTILGSILAGAPDAYAALELKALTQKAKTQDFEALKTYGDLERIGPIERRGSYYFEIGSLLQRNRRFVSSREYFNKAIEAKFNVGASHYFLGLLDYDDKKWDAAEKHLTAALDSEAEELRPLISFYLGLLYQRMQRPTQSVRGLQNAIEGVDPWKHGSDEEQKKMADKIERISEQMLKPYRPGRWDGSLTVMTQYDTNVTLLPDAVTTAQQVAGKHTGKALAAASFVYTSSPLRKWQHLFTYRGYFNVNSNFEAKTFDFLSNIPAVYVNYRPYNRFSPGFKIEGNYTFQNLAGRGTAFEFHPLSLTGDAGPYARYEVNHRIYVEADAFYRPKKYYTDPERGEDRRSGNGYSFRGSVSYKSPLRLLAPAFYVGYEKDNTDGRNWRSTALGFGLSNTMELTPADTLTGALDMTFPRYSERFPERRDTYVGFRALGAHVLKRQMNLLLDINYVLNRSNLDTIYSYNRFFGGVGIQFVY